MAYGKGNQDREFTGVTSGMFKTKKPGLLVGNYDGQYLRDLKDIIDQALDERTGVSLFFNKLEEPEGKKVARLTIDVSKGGGNYKSSGNSRGRGRDEERSERSERGGRGRGRDEDRDEPREERSERGGRSRKSNDGDDW